MKQIKKTFLEGESPTLTVVTKNSILVVFGVLALPLLSDQKVLTPSTPFEKYPYPLPTLKKFSLPFPFLSYLMLSLIKPECVNNANAFVWFYRMFSEKTFLTQYLILHLESKKCYLLFPKSLT